MKTYYLASERNVDVTVQRCGFGVLYELFCAESGCGLGSMFYRTGGDADGYEAGEDQFDEDAETELTEEEVEDLRVQLLATEKAGS